MDASTFFATAVDLISNTMDDCHYSDYTRKRLMDMSLSWDGDANPLTKMDLYFLHNLAMLVTCTLADYTDTAGDNRSLRDRVALYQTKKKQVETALPAMIVQLETKLTTVATAPAETDLSSRLEAASILVLRLQQSLAEMQSQVKDEAGPQKRLREQSTDLQTMHVFLQRMI